MKLRIGSCPRPLLYGNTPGSESSYFCATVELCHCRRLQVYSGFIKCTRLIVIPNVYAKFRFKADSFFVVIIYYNTPMLNLSFFGDF